MGRRIIAEAEVFNTAIGGGHHEGKRVAMRVWFVGAQSQDTDLGAADDADDTGDRAECKNLEPTTRPREE